MVFKNTLKNKIYTIVFGTDTHAGKNFDVILLWLIIASIIIVLLESVSAFGLKYNQLLTTFEWIFTIIFTIEYLVRIWCSPHPLKYIFSFWGLIDFLSTIPAYFTLLFSSAKYLIGIRSLRLMRIFKILKLGQFNSEGNMLLSALKRSRHKIVVFLLFITLLVFILGTLMYVVEDGRNGFHNIPESIYWSIVTITTVGYGDIVPKTMLGKIISSIMMIIGYAIIAIPTGIVSVSMHQEKNGKFCSKCKNQLSENAKFCSNCGEAVT